MCCLFNVIVLHIGYDPDISGVLTERVRGQFTPPRPFECPLPWVLLRDSDGVQLEDVIRTFGEPEDRLMST